MEISIIRAEDACTAVRSERGSCTAEERQRYYGGWGVLNAVVRSSYCDSTSSRLELCHCCVPLLCASEVCCAVVVLLWKVVLVYARDTYALSK